MLNKRNLPFPDINLSVMALSSYSTPLQSTPTSPELISWAVILVTFRFQQSDRFVATVLMSYFCSVMVNHVYIIFNHIYERLPTTSYLIRNICIIGCSGWLFTIYSDTTGKYNFSLKKKQILQLIQLQRVHLQFKRFVGITLSYKAYAELREYA